MGISSRFPWGMMLSGILLGQAMSDPAAAASLGAFQPVGMMMQGRILSQATALADGTVLLTGGETISDSGEVVLTSAERFDPRTNSFTAAGSLTQGRDEGHRALRLQDGRVLVTGGSVDGQSQSNTAELFDPSTGMFASTGEMTQARSGHTVTMLPDGRVLVVGGYSSGGPQATAELFDPASGTFQKTGSMTQRRYHHAAVALPDGRVAIFGGTDPQDRPVLEVEIYDPQTGQFSTQGKIANKRSGWFTATLLSNGQILLAGGDYDVTPNGDTVYLSSAEIYDPATGRSRLTNPLSTPRDASAAILLGNGSVLVVGGRSDGSGTTWLRTSELIDPNTGTVSPGPSLTVERGGAAVVPLPDGRALFAGGLTNGADPVLASAEVYVP